MDVLSDFISNIRPYIGIISAISSILSIITWFVALPFLIFAWRRAKEIKISLFGIEATFQQGLEAAAAIGAATASKASTTDQPLNGLRTGAVVQSVGRALIASRGGGIRGKSILWVDDNPMSNKYERQALTALGIQVSCALDTELALEQLHTRHFDLVISDMGRPSGAQAGYSLLKRLRADDQKIPFLIYAGSNSLEHKAEARRLDAQGSTNDPQELLELVLSTLMGVKSHAEVSV